MLAVALSLSFASPAQTTDPSAAPQQIVRGKISGKVIDGNTKTIESATITLLRSKDSSVAKMSVADKTGKFEFADVAEGKYFVSISAVGHDKGLSEPIEINASNLDITLKTIELVPQAKSISGVTVTSKRPLIEQKAGKTLINVEASPTNTGLNALEVLEKAPGVSVDNDGNISLKGKQGVMILIDGKPTYMSGADLAALLKNMQSSSLDQIEIMTNPPAKYDAAGNSGIINIKTKKGIVKGTNGSVNASFTQGKYSRFNAGLNLNYRNEKINLFGGYNGGKYEGYNKLVIDRKIYQSDNKTIFRLADQVSRPHFEGLYHNIKAGLDYSFTKRTVLGFVVNANLNDNDEDPISTAFMRFPDRTVDYRIESNGLNTSVIK
ncbi:MAG: TonB-dependent receptor [Chitinophagaceae bacterium]|nr:MAG: TonB-dependent receptor [Chitinophagaceae bacterium]